ncbi:Cytochrome P450, E-class, group I [Trema orientale]|uniref:Cytochrome P450, E-class, group I n=1 Tax=Trema orientale TaxID=63057 RepID=A0A2P5CDS9_TREOI|nr:Cytochrome P450, E-class, group I [Trema orientale]
MFLYFLLLLVFYALTNHFLNKFRNFPPIPFPTLPIIGHLYLLIKPHHFHRTLTKISNRFGPVFLLRFGSRRILIISSPSAAEECLKQKDVFFANRPLDLLSGKHLGYNYTTIATSSYNDHWRNLRRISTFEILSVNRLNTLLHIRTDEVRLLVHRLLHLQNQEDRNPVLDMRPLFTEVTLNIMMRMIAGKRYYEDCVVSKEDAEEAETFRKMIKESIELTSYSSVRDYLPVLRWVGVGRGFEKSLIELQKKRDGFMHILIEQHKKNMASSNSNSSHDEKKTKTMIGVLLSLQESEPEYYKDEIIKGLVLDLLAAGTETSAGTMEMALSFLLNHPEAMKKAHTELVNCVGHGRLVNESDLANLPYLHCIIKETLRLIPPGPLIPHASSKETTVSGYHVPGGCMVLVNIWAIQRDPNVWAEPNKFKPERFLEGAELREGFKLLPFGYGRRICPGENLALRMVGLTLASIIQCFEWERVTEKMVDMDETARGLTVSLTNPLQAMCRPRSTMMNVLSQI